MPEIATDTDLLCQNCGDERATMTVEGLDVCVGCGTDLEASGF